MYHAGSNQFSRIELQIILLPTASDNLFPFSRWGKYIKGGNKLGNPKPWANTVSVIFLLELIVSIVTLACPENSVLGQGPVHSNYNKFSQIFWFPCLA